MMQMSCLTREDLVQVRRGLKKDHRRSAPTSVVHTVSANKTRTVRRRTKMQPTRAKKSIRGISNDNTHDTINLLQTERVSISGTCWPCAAVSHGHNSSVPSPVRMELWGTVNARKLSSKPLRSLVLTRAMIWVSRARTLLPEPRQKTHPRHHPGNLHQM